MLEVNAHRLGMESVTARPHGELMAQYALDDSLLVFVKAAEYEDKPIYLYVTEPKWNPEYEYVLFRMPVEEAIEVSKINQLAIDQLTEIAESQECDCCDEETEESLLMGAVEAGILEIQEHIENEDAEQLKICLSTMEALLPHIAEYDEDRAKSIAMAIRLSTALVEFMD